MYRLQTDKLHVTISSGVERDVFVLPRCYTLTYSDRTGELFLTVGKEHDLRQIGGWYTRLLRDEVLGEWLEEGPQRHLLVHCHVSGGLVFGWAGMRYAIFKRELPLALEAIRYGDRVIFDRHPDLDRAPLLVRFHSSRLEYDKVESWGTPSDYRI